jgi:hypothetical protein
MLFKPRYSPPIKGVQVSRLSFRHTLLPIGLAFAAGILSAQSSTSLTPAYGNCPAPSSAGVRVCFPLSGDIDSPMQVIASGTGAEGPVKTMQLWVDGKKVQQVSGNLFDKPVTLTNATHRIVIVEADSTGAYKASAPISVNVQTSTAGESCSPPSAPGVNVCLPASGSCQVSNFTSIVASGTAPSGASVVRMELWVNGKKLYNADGSVINTNLSLPANSRIVIQEVDSSGGHIASTPAYVNPC